jgi:hypothetical protein
MKPGPPACLYILIPLPDAARDVPPFFPVLDRFARSGWVTTVCPTQGQEDAARLAEDLRPGYDRVVCGGGDGDAQ